MMSKVLLNKLEDRFPWAKDVFIPVEDGWFSLIWNMFEEFDALPEKPKVFEINEKYGEMTVDISSKVSAAWIIVEKHQALSENVCETCGAEGSIREVNGWLNAYCDNCFDSAKAEHEKKFNSSKGEGEIY